MRVARSRELVAGGFAVAAVTRVLQVSRQAVYRTPTPRRPPQRRPATDPVERAIVEVAEQKQTDGYRMVAAMTRQKLGRAVNRKRVLRVMRERKLIQRRRPLERRKRPGFFRVERPRQLWQLDMASVWVAEHGWYLNDPPRSPGHGRIYPNTKNKRPSLSTPAGSRSVAAYEIGHASSSITSRTRRSTPTK